MPTTHPARKITPGRMKTLFTTANAVIKAFGTWKDTDEFKTEWLYPEFDVSSTKDLSVKQADAAIGSLQRMLGDGVERASFPQQEKIKALAELLGMSTTRKYEFIERQVGYKKSERMCTPKEAGKIIVGLQKIFAQGDSELYQTLNKVSARYIRSQKGKEALEQLKNSSLVVNR